VLSIFLHQHFLYYSEAPNPKAVKSKHKSNKLRYQNKCNIIIRVRHAIFNCRENQKKEKQLRRKTRHKPPTRNATSKKFVVQVNMKIELQHAKKTKVNKVCHPPFPSAA
jgi:hypothetical protein